MAALTAASVKPEVRVDASKFKFIHNLKLIELRAGIVQPVTGTVERCQWPGPGVLY